MVKEIRMQAASHAHAPALAGAGPWYSHRWPWLLMLGPVFVICGGAFAGYLAISRPDAMVVDDYYKQGKAINQDLRRDRVASSMQLTFRAHYDQASGTLIGAIDSAGTPLAAPLHIYLAHPTLPGRDLRLLVQPDAAGRFSAALPALEHTHWQVVVEGARREWRLARSWSWPQQPALEIVADAAAGQ
jgi:hypothetical protein